jgi:TRAP-type C4-dicarboxylate transport system permease small subunit
MKKPRVEMLYRAIGKIEDWIMVSALGYMACVTFLQVIMRYIFKNPLSWPEETARFVQIWLVYISASACVRAGRHIKVDTAIELMGPPFRRFFERVAVLFTLVLLLLMFYLGLLLVNDFVHFGQKSPALSIPMYWVAISIPMGMGLSILRYLRLFFEQKGQESSPP